MRKPIPTTVHGILDYVSVSTLLVLPRVFGWNKKLTTLLSGAALGTLAYSLMTRYELSPLKLIPMKGHLALDFLNGATLATAPFILLDDDERDGATTGFLLGFGAFEIAASLMSQTEPSSMVEGNPVEQVRELIGSRS